MAIMKQDTGFCVGSLVLKRERGYPMGGSFSEPCTLIDLQEDIYQCSTSVSRRKQCGWNCLDLNFSEQVTGLTRVDDTAALSKVYCINCLFLLPTQTSPNDVGLSQEDQGQVMRFLSSFVVLDSEVLIDEYLRDILDHISCIFRRFPKIRKMNNVVAS